MKSFFRKNYTIKVSDSTSVYEIEVKALNEINAIRKAKEQLGYHENTLLARFELVK